MRQLYNLTSTTTRGNLDATIAHIINAIKPDSVLRNYRVTLENHVTDDTLGSYESGSMHTNYGDTGTHTLTLPSDAITGTTFDIVVGAAQQLRVAVGAATHVIILGGTVNTDDGGADGYVWADDEGESATFTLIATGVWLASHVTGTWTWVQP